MRKLGIVMLVVVCLVGTVPVMAAEDGERVGWWDGVVEWVSVIFPMGPHQEMGPNVEPDGLSQDESEASEPDMGPNVEPDGLTRGAPTLGPSTI